MSRPRTRTTPSTQRRLAPAVPPVPNDGGARDRELAFRLSVDGLLAEMADARAEGRELAPPVATMPI